MLRIDELQIGYDEMRQYETTDALLARNVITMIPQPQDQLA